MNLFQGQEALTAIEWIVRAAVGFGFLVVVARVLGQRTISQLRILDFVIALVIGNIIAHPLSDHHIGMKGSIITTIILVAFYLIGIFLLLKFPWLRTLITHKTITIVKNGEILYGGLKKARISLDVLLEELREKQVEDVKKVALAIWEADGKISFFLDPKYMPVTRADLQIETKPFDMPRTIIKEGKLLTSELQHTRKDESWVASRLEHLYQTKIEEVLLATLDNKDNLNVFLYKN